MTARTGPRSWSSTQTRGPSGAFDSVQRVEFPSPVVERSRAGATRLGEVYWREVERATFGVVRARDDGAGVEIRLLGVGPPLLRFCAARHEVGACNVTCSYPIRGGLLARSAGGSLTFTQLGSEHVEVRSAISGFFPRLAARRKRRWNDVVYEHIQARLHVALGRRYFARLWLEATQ